MTQVADAAGVDVAGSAGDIPAEATAVSGRRSVATVARALFLLTKPRIIELLLVTTLPTMLLARRGLPSLELIAVTLIGGALAAGSANTLNCYLDRDIDAIMRRTSRRPLVAARGGRAAIKPGEALASGVLLGAAGHAAPRAAGELAVGSAGRRCDRVLRVRLHDGPEAAYGVQHRDRRRGWLLPGAGRLGSRHRYGVLAGNRAVRGHLLLDTTALLGAGNEVQGGLRVRRRAHAAGCGDGSARWRARSSFTPTAWLRRPWLSRRTQAGRTAGARSGSASGSWPRHTGCAAGWRAARRPRRCGCSTCPLRT